jgi:predicted transcriptional regulator
MLETLITSKTRIKLLMKFFLNSSTTSYLRDLATEFGESTNAIRLELNHLEEAGLLKSRNEKNKKVFQANRQHPLYCDIHRLLLKHTGIDQVIENVLQGLGGLQSAYVTGNFAHGHDSSVIELLLVGNTIDEEYLGQLIGKIQPLIKREIRYIIRETNGTPASALTFPDALLLWKANGSER